MAKVDPRQKIQKYHTEDEMRQALHNFIMRQAGGSPFPQDDDDDIVINDVIEEPLQARALITEMRNFVQIWLAKATIKR